ncbi:hypothetical protein AC578_2193 [Pseudocercospora eumusae]|uniref:Uncharacterized protein n=1 Tax=Pseudocercospora eumusae TaxID=321146 RepID=A0A139GYN2_9PEZI|nr:hypothetical protein AC578_2193 [Pseudocercospora eumusae]
MVTHDPDLASWDIDNVRSWCAEAGCEPASEPGTPARRFESLSEEDLIDNARIKWTEEGIKKVRSFCAKHQVSTRNRPSPEQLLELVDQICVLNNVFAFQNAAKKVLSCIDRYVSNKCPALDEEQQQDGTWKCVWYRFSEAWFQPGWNGNTNAPAGGNPWEERPVILRRHKMGEVGLINAAVNVRASHLRALPIAAKSTEKNEERAQKTPAPVTVHVHYHGGEEQTDQSKENKEASPTNVAEESSHRAQTVKPVEKALGTTGAPAVEVPEDEEDPPTILHQKSPLDAVGDVQTMQSVEKAIEKPADDQYEVDQILATYTGPNNQSFMVVKYKDVAAPVVVPVVAQLGQNIKAGKDAGSKLDSGSVKQVKFQHEAAVPVPPRTPSPQPHSFRRREPDAPKRRSQAGDLDYNETSDDGDNDADQSDTSEHGDETTQAKGSEDGDEKADDSDAYAHSDASSASLQKVAESLTKRVNAVVRNGTDTKQKSKQKGKQQQPAVPVPKSWFSSLKQPPAPPPSSFKKHVTSKTEPSPSAGKKKTTAPAFTFTFGQTQAPDADGDFEDFL